MATSVTADQLIQELGQIVAAQNKAEGTTTGSCTFTVDGKERCLPDLTSDQCDRISLGKGTWVEGGSCKGWK
jgi:hypothetical protein